MSFMNILKAPSKFLKKHVITFLLIRRHDLGLTEQSLRYVAVRPSASVSRLRRKIWYLLDLPDYCDEVIVLKSSDEREIPLTSLCRGNDPQHPYILEVWLPEKPMLCISAGSKNMLTMGHKKSITETKQESRNDVREEALQDEVGKTVVNNQKDVDVNKTGALENHRLTNILHADQKRSDLSFKFSNSSLFFKIPKRNSADNFTGILLKIQNDLSTLSSKLTHLENKLEV